MTESVVVPVADARDRILASAYLLFSQRGVRDVGVDELVEHANVAKATLYNHFGTKDDLVLAFLAERERLWTLGFVVREAEARGKTPEGRVLAIFDAFAEWFRRDDFEACSFINVLLELRVGHPAGEASIEYLEHIRDVLRRLAEEAQLAEVDEFARSCHILMKGSIIAAAEGDRLAAGRAKKMARTLIEQHRTT
jgi:AcrR family transcriptional regulator